MAMPGQQQIIMSFSYPPSVDELEVMANSALENLPEELIEFCEEVSIQVEELADETIEQELDLDDPFELLALYRNGKEISPGVEKKVANEDAVLILYRRPLLDLWCETYEDLSNLIRKCMVEELGAQFDFSDDEIEEMAGRHYQGML